MNKLTKQKCGSKPVYGAYPLYPWECLPPIIQGLYAVSPLGFLWLAPLYPLYEEDDFELDDEQLDFFMNLEDE